jgi:hypothetical protein
MQVETASEALSPNATANTGGDALQPEMLRDAVWRLARDGAQSAELDALDFRLRIKVLPVSRRWQGPQAQQGITDLEFTLIRP